MRKLRAMGNGSSWVLWMLLSLLALSGLWARGAAQEKGAPAASGGKFIGAEKCKTCHEAKNKGSQYTVWKGTKHAKAYDVLASEEAKKTAKAMGIEDAQKSDKCLKCHVTGHGEAPERFAKGFEMKGGVQCESCHGPGEKHFKARLAASEEESDELVTLPPGEIIQSPSVETCLGCHNEESPQFQPFCFHKRSAEVRHPDPRKKGGAKDKCGCGDSCSCKKGECGSPPGEKK